MDIDIQNLATVASSGGFALLTWYLITRTLPAERQAFREEMAEERKDNRIWMERFLSALDGMRIAISNCPAKRTEDDAQAQ